MTTPAASGGERRWWIAAVCWTGGLYVGTALAQQIMLALRDRGLLTGTVTTAFALIGLTSAAAVVRAGGRRHALLAATAFVLVYAGILHGLPVVQERLHFIQFGVLALLCQQALERRGARLAAAATPSRSWWCRHPDLGGITLGALGGFGDELVQAVVPSRVFDWRDVGFNAAAALLAVAAARTLRSAIDADRAG